jgi:hypothetical protein
MTLYGSTHKVLIGEHVLEYPESAQVWVIAHEIAHIITLPEFKMLELMIDLFKDTWLQSIRICFFALHELRSH